MAYSPSSAINFRSKPGTLSTKLATEFSAISGEFNGGVKVAKVALTAGAQNAIAFAWQNPESSAIIVSKIIMRITAGGGTPAATMDIGVVADATSTADTLLDGVDITAAGLFDNVTNKGTNGKPQIAVDEKGGTNDYISGKILGANAASLAGKVYIMYMVV